jgi:hypothetical protein
MILVKNQVQIKSIVNRFNKFWKYLSLICPFFCLIYIVFIFGVLVSEFRIYPFYDALSPSLRAIDAVKNQGVRILFGKKKVVETKKTFNESNLWVPEVKKGGGVISCQKEKLSDGYTLITRGVTQDALLLDSMGREVHRWHKRFEDIWGVEPKHLTESNSSQLYAWRMTRLLKNGSLLVVFVREPDTPWGCGLAKIDKNSNVIWTLDQRVHHDVSVDEQGRIYTLIHEVSWRKRRELKQIYPPYIEDSIVVLSPDGDVMQRINVLDAIVSGMPPEKDAIPLNNVGDTVHCNAVSRVPKWFAEINHDVEAGWLMVSMRNLSAIGFICPSSGQMKRLIHGPWSVQHDPGFLRNGNLLIFDNCGLGGPIKKTRIIEYNINSRNIDWEYTAEDFFSNVRGTVRKLDNGNVLICESQRGRVMEVSRNKEVVWEWLNPEQVVVDGVIYRSTVHCAERISQDDLEFLAVSGK